MAISVNVDENNVKDVIKAFQFLYDNIEKYVEETDRKIIEESKNYLDQQYASRIKDPNITDISTSWSKKGKEYELKASGKDVVYEEFGTGDKGEQNPHPDKSKYNLNDYNSGDFIMDVGDISNQDMLDILAENGISSGKFWRYRKHGETYLTQGVPSGKEMWNTRNELIDNIIPKATKELGVELREKFTRAVKS